MSEVISVSVHLKETSQPIIHDNVINIYQKGDLFILYTDNEKSFKYPIANIWRIIEDYGFHGREVAPRLHLIDDEQLHQLHPANFFVKKE